MFFDAWVAPLIILLVAFSIIATIAYRLETRRPLYDSPWFYAIMCTCVTVLVWILLPDIEEVNPSLKTPLIVIGLIIFCVGVVLYAVMLVRSILKIRHRRRQEKRLEQERRETVESEDFARFIDEELGMVITLDKSRGIMTVLVKEENDDETQED